MENKTLIMCIPANRGSLYNPDNKIGTCWVPRGEAEIDPVFRQVIPYCALQRDDGKILSYRRKGSEERLHGKLSIGIGGHIDYPQTFSESMGRELYEEAGVMNYVSTKLGLIELSDTEVDRVHLGIGFLVESDEYEPGEELLNPAWMTIEELDAINDEFEPWSQKLLWLIKNPF